MAESPRYFLLSIAIDEYKCPNILPLNGSVNDATAMEACLAEVLGDVPSTAIFSLRNADATRSAIINAFYTHLINNRNIKKDDAIIIFYAGHGGRVKPPARWGIDSDTVETICPSDEATGDGDDLVHGIPDITINALLLILAREKGNNITFICDSCHSGGISRGLTDELPGFRARYAGQTQIPLPPDIDSAILDDANVGKGAFGFRGNHSSHILLAACTDTERAFEVEGDGKPRSGQFTTALTRALRRLADKIAFITYAALMDSLEFPSGFPQHPQCDGNFVNSFLFSRRTDPPPCIFRLIAQGHDYLVSAGEAHGLVRGTEMTVWDACGRNKLGILVCHTVGPISSSCTAQMTTENTVKGPLRPWASVHRWNIGALRIHSEFTKCLDSVSEYPIISTGRKNAHIALRATDPNHDVTIERCEGDPLLAPYTRHYTIPTIPRELDLPSVLNNIAHFYFHLGRQKPAAANMEPKELNDVLASQVVELLMYPMMPYGHRYKPKMSNLLKNNVAHLDLVEGSRYGFEILNKSGWDLYAYLFCFDPSDYSIAGIWMPPMGSTGPPLPADGSITIGYGSGGGLPLHFCPSSRGLKLTDTVFFKLFVSTKDINMHHIPQSSPLRAQESSPAPEFNHLAAQAVSREIVRRDAEKLPLPDVWDVSLAAVHIYQGRSLFDRLLY
ncbi:caspase domain-containing protein [Mycena latifolia]|nr:caspase domain-containing protein [Mycena latifolia]